MTDDVVVSRAGDLIRIVHMVDEKFFDSICLEIKDAEKLVALLEQEIQEYGRSKG